MAVGYSLSAVGIFYPLAKSHNITAYSQKLNIHQKIEDNAKVLCTLALSLLSPLNKIKK